MQSIASWMEEGIEIGFEQGFSEGLQQGMNRLIIRQLSEQFGQLEPEIKKKISLFDTSQLEILGVKLLTFKNLEDLATFLASIEKKKAEIKGSH